MRILQVAPLSVTVPPPAYGGTEAVVSVLCEDLVRRGHDVTLCASGDSITRAELFSIYPRSLRMASDIRDKLPYQLVHAALSLKEAKSFDIIHNHAGEMVMAMSHLVNVPMLTTMHCLVTPDNKFLWDTYEGWYNTISLSEKALMPSIANKKYCGTVYNGIDVASFPYDKDKEDYLLFLSCVSPDKAPHLAVEAAKRLGRRIIVAGKVDPNGKDQEYFRTTLAPLVDGQQVQFFGEANSEQKRRLYAKACCLLMPLCWEEPFGLVMAEAMACGTPVVAFRRGAAAEVVVHGETGYLVNDVDGMVEAVLKVDRIDPARCRRHVVENFGPERMADGYLRIYQRILDRVAVRPTLTSLAPAAPSLVTEATGQETAVA
jgi:glycosyltransferase involved in cell wall biosynthesis